MDELRLCTLLCNISAERRGARPPRPPRIELHAPMDSSTVVQPSFRAAASALSNFDSRHVNTSMCSYVVPDIDGTGTLHAQYPSIVRQLNRDCQPAHVTRYPTMWNLGFFFLREAAEGRKYGGDVLEISGQSSIRRYLLRPRTRFTEAYYPAVDVQALDRAYAAASFDLVIAESVIEHVPNPLLAVLQMHRVLRPGGHLLLMVPSTYP